MVPANNRLCDFMGFHVLQQNFSLYLSFCSFSYISISHSLSLSLSISLSLFLSFSLSPCVSVVFSFSPYFVYYSLLLCLAIPLFSISLPPSLPLSLPPSLPPSLSLSRSLSPYLSRSREGTPYTMAAGKIELTITKDLLQCRETVRCGDLISSFTCAGQHPARTQWTHLKNALQTLIIPQEVKLKS